MMRRWAIGKVGGLFVLGMALTLGGCSGAGTTGGGAGGSGAGGAKGSSDDLASKIGDYMPPLDGGRLEIAPPKGWEWANPGGGVLVAFKPKGAELNSLPRILVSVADSDSVGIDNVAADNVEAFARQVADSLPEPKPKEPVRAVSLGKHQFARYITFGKRRNQVVAQQTVTTAVGGRVYTLRLEVYQHQFDKYQAALSAVAMSMKFPGGDAAQATEPAAEEPPAAEAAGKSKEEAESDQPTAKTAKEESAEAKPPQ
ncbi:MAG TPA: hypothetical protein PLF81_11445 [Candidatus Anammoximicrobium sp.]|nr:hypothetical protein [Candidatus Anammoximicrobium sp.]